MQGDIWGFLGGLAGLAWPGLPGQAGLAGVGLGWAGGGAKRGGGAGNAKSSNLKRKFNKEIASRMQGDNFGFFGIWLGWAGLDWPARLAWPGLVRLQDLPPGRSPEVVLKRSLLSGRRLEASWRRLGRP